jgi:MFS family permease
VLGLYSTLGSALGALGPPAVLGLLAVLHKDWRQMWLIEAGAALAIGVLCALVTGGPQWLAAAGAGLERKIAEERAKPQRVRRVHRAQEDWTLAQAVRTPQFYVLLAAYFGHVTCLATTASFTMAHLTQRGVSPYVVGAMLSIEALAGMAWRMIAGFLGDIVDARYILIFALGSLVIGMGALSVAQGYVSLIVFAIGTGIGFTVTALAIMVLVGDYFGRAHNLEIFSTICLVGAASALGPTFGGLMRDHFGGFASTFQILALLNAAAFLAAVVMRPPHRKSAVGEPVVSEAPMRVEAMKLADPA